MRGGRIKRGVGGHRQELGSRSRRNLLAELTPNIMALGDNSEYALSIKQQPLRARMAGQGEKSDRRPLDPPPVISLRLRRASAQKRKELTDDDYVSPTLTHSLFMFASLVGEHDDKEVYIDRKSVV